MRDNEEQAKRTIALYKSVFNSSEGKQVLFDLMKGNFVLGTTFVPKDPYEMALREGQRYSIIKILAILEIDPEQFVKSTSEEENHV